MSNTARFANLFSDALEATFCEIEADKIRLREQIDQLKFRQQEIEADIQETQHFIEQIDDDIAVGLKHAAKDAGVKIDVPAAIAPKKVNRLTPKASGPEIESVLMFIPLEKKHAVKISEIRAKVEFGRKVLEWIMLQLFKMGKIAKVGKSNQMRYYKKGRTLKQG